MLGTTPGDVAPMGIDWRVDSIAENEGLATVHDLVGFSM